MAAQLTVAAAIKLVGSFSRWMSGRGKEKKCKSYADSINNALEVAESFSARPDNYFDLLVPAVLALIKPYGFNEAMVRGGLEDGRKSGGRKEAGFNRLGRHRGLKPLYRYDGSIESAVIVLQLGVEEVLATIQSDCGAQADATGQVAAGFSLINEVMKPEPNWADVLKYVTIAAGGDAGEVRRILAELKRSNPNALLPDEVLGLNPIADLGNIVEGIKGSIDKLLTQVQEWLQNIIDEIVDTLTAVVETITETVGEIVESVVNSIGDAIDTAVAYIENMAAEITSTIGIFIEDATAAIQSAFEATVNYVGELIQQVSDWIVEITAALQQEIQDIFDGVDEVIHSIQQSVGELVDEVVSGAQGAMTTVQEAVESIPAAVREIAAPILEHLKEQPERIRQGFDYLVKELGGIDLSPDTEAVKARNIRHLSVAFDIMGLDKQTADSMAEQIYRAAPDGPITGAVFFITLLGSLIFQGVSVPAGIAMEKARQGYNIAMPTKLMAEADQLVAAIRELKPKDVVIRELRALGYSESDAEVLYEERRQLMPAGEVIVWWLRGLLSNDELERYLAHSGISSDDIAKLKEAAFFIPPPQDLITMAVRDVFSPETAEKFGQFEDFPPAFAQWAAKQGVSEEWAKNYWAAHWSLPSPNQGFEMLQRGIIDEPTLSMLLKALDVMPFWRDKMIKLSYNVLTRVDVRRMHDIGVLDRAGVVKAYRDMGYSPDDAESLTQFTEKLNQNKTADDDTELTQISRASIVKFYSAGVIDRERAATLLKGLGISDDGTELYLDLADMEIELQERRAEIDLIIEQEGAGIITFEEATGKIGELGFSTLEQQKAVAKLTKRQKQEIKLPSRAELDKMRVANIIDDKVYRDTMSRNGYAHVWIERYLALVKAGIEADA